MNILVIGQGGREHAIAWKIAQSTQVTHVYVAPGNPGMAMENKVTCLDLDVMDFGGLIQFAKDHQVHLSVVGPEGPLSEGIVDAFKKEGLACFGPNQKAAQLEASKDFTKAFLTKYSIPTASYETFEHVDKAKAHLNDVQYPVVIKADGLCQGKGVVIAQNQTQAYQTLERMMVQTQFGQASKKVIIEECLVGEEASFIIMTDGKSLFDFASSQDHKARDDGDSGPNTGGMGAYSPAPVITQTMHDAIINTIVQPTLDGLISESIDFCGFLYVGVMVTKDGPKVLEFNCRLGDPEAQPLLMRLENDLVDLIEHCLNGKLNQCTPQWSPHTTISVVLASNGYPSNPEKGQSIRLPSEDKGQKIFHAGTQAKDDDLVVAGGRILSACALGKDIASAQKSAYALIEQIQCKDSFYRTDIGDKACRKVKEHETLTA